MSEKEIDMLSRVVERYLFHSNYTTNNPEFMRIAETMRDIELTEMWMLTQGSDRT